MLAKAQTKKEEEMKQAYTPLLRVAAGAMMVAAFAVPGQLPASAQQSTTTTSPSAATMKVPRTSATPDMIEDAIERSQSRTERSRRLGIPEQFGSEDPARFSVKKK
jgi:hypothetical protein